MFKMCQEVGIQYFPASGDAWSTTSISSKLDCIKHQTPPSSTQYPLPFPSPTQTRSYFLTLCTRKILIPRVLKLSRNRLREKTVSVSAARECRVGEAATSADTRHGNYPINLTFSASDVIQTQNMDC